MPGFPLWSPPGLQNSAPPGPHGWGEDLYQKRMKENPHHQSHPSGQVSLWPPSWSPGAPGRWPHQQPGVAHTLLRGEAVACFIPQVLENVTVQVRQLLAHDLQGPVGLAFGLGEAAPARCPAAPVPAPAARWSPAFSCDSSGRPPCSCPAFGCPGPGPAGSLSLGTAPAAR